MTALLLDGRPVAAAHKEQIAAEVRDLLARYGWAPGIAVVLVGGDPASVAYAQQIGKSFLSVGMRFDLHELPDGSSEVAVLRLITKLNNDASVDGIIVQLPLPEGIDASKVAATISPEKDVDGISPYNAGLLLAGAKDYFAPATPAGAIVLLKHFNIPIQGQRAVVIGRSNIVGKPMALLLLHEHATVSICHTRTTESPCLTRDADILVAAAGKPGMVTADMVKPGAVVIDFGTNFVKGRLVGDVDFASVSEVASAITPVPGGTGPMTNVMLMRNTLRAAIKRRQ